jgi:hypothetical protein
MSWRERLRALVCAGGSAAVAASLSGCIGTCNANPDPCCRDPQSEQCAEWKMCEASNPHDVETCFENRFDLSTPDLAPTSVDDAGAAD